MLSVDRIIPPAIYSSPFAHVQGVKKELSDEATAKSSHKRSAACLAAATNGTVASNNASSRSARIGSKALTTQYRLARVQRTFRELVTLWNRSKPLSSEISKREQIFYRMIPHIDLTVEVATASMLFRYAFRYKRKTLLDYLVNSNAKLTENTPENLDNMLSLTEMAPQHVWRVLQNNARVLFSSSSSSSSQVTSREVRSKQLHENLWKIAATTGSLQMAEHLLRANVPILAAGHFYTMLIIALKQKRKDVAALLKASYPNFNPADKALVSLLLEGAKTRNLTMLEFLVNAGVGDDGYAITHCVINGYEAEIALLTNSAKNVKGALHCYLKTNKEICQFTEVHRQHLDRLITLGADVDYLRGGRTFVTAAYVLATNENAPWAVSSFIKLIDWFHANSGDFFLHQHASNDLLVATVVDNRHDLTCYILNLLPKDVLLRNAYSLNAAFRHAICWAQEPVYRKLKECGADGVNAGLVSLLSASAPGDAVRRTTQWQKRFTALVQEWGASPNGSEEGMPYIFLALKSGNNNLAVSLLEMGANYFGTDDNGFGFLSYIVAYGIQIKASDQALANMVQNALAALTDQTQACMASIDDLFAAEVLLRAKGFDATQRQLMTHICRLQCRTDSQTKATHRVAPNRWWFDCSIHPFQELAGEELADAIAEAYAITTKGFEMTTMTYSAPVSQKKQQVDRVTLMERLPLLIAAWKEEKKTVAAECRVPALIDFVCKLSKQKTHKEAANNWMVDQWMNDWRKEEYAKTCSTVQNELSDSIVDFQIKHGSCRDPQSRKRFSEEIWKKLVDFTSNPSSTASPSSAPIEIRDFQRLILEIFTSATALKEKTAAIMPFIRDAAAKTRYSDFISLQLDSNGHIKRSKIRTILHDLGVLTVHLPPPENNSASKKLSLSTIVSIVPHEMMVNA